MNLYLDDRRPAPDGFKLVRNYNDCVFWLGTSDFDRVSLDYSLGEKRTGLDVLKWMAEENRYPKTVNIHSGDDWACSVMAEYIRTHFPKDYPFTVKTIW